MARAEDRFIDALEETPVEAVATEPVPEPPQRPLTLRTVFEHPESHPLVLDTLLLEEYGPLWLDWEAETIWSEIRDDFKTPGVSVINRNKIQAVKLCHLMETPWEAWEVFTPVCMAFTGNIPHFRIFQKPSPAQILITVDILHRIDSHPFSEEMGKFIAASFLDEGIHYLPPPVDFAQTWASEPQYRCKVCGKIDRDDTNEVCDSCGAPESELVKEPVRDFRPVEARFKSIQSLPDGQRPELGETVEDVQTAKLLVAFDLVDLHRKQLEEQLRMVHDVRSHL